MGRQLARSCPDSGYPLSRIKDRNISYPLIQERLSILFYVHPAILRSKKRALIIKAVHGIDPRRGFQVQSMIDKTV